MTDRAGPPSPRLPPFAESSGRHGAPTSRAATGHVAEPLDALEAATANLLLEAAPPQARPAPPAVGGGASAAASPPRSAPGRPDSLQHALDEVNDAASAVALLADAAAGARLGEVVDLDLASLDLGWHHVARLGALYGPAAGAAPRLPASLSLKLNPLGPRGAGALAGWPTLHGLRELDLGCAELGDEGVARLVGGRYPSLERLHLSSNGLTAVGAQALVEAPLWPALRILGLGDDDLGDDGALVLAVAPAARLEGLDLRWNCLSPAGAQLLGQRLPGTRVSLLDNGIGRAAAAELRAQHANLDVS